MGNCHDTLIISNAIEPVVGGGLGGIFPGSQDPDSHKIFPKIHPEFDRKHILV